MTDYSKYEKLAIDWPADGVLRVTMNNTESKMNTADAKMHRELAYIWPEIDHDESVGAVILRGQDKVFSAGGDFERVPTSLSRRVGFSTSDAAALWRWATGTDDGYYGGSLGTCPSRLW